MTIRPDLSRGPAGRSEAGRENLILVERAIVLFRTILCSMVRSFQKVVLFLFFIGLAMSGPLAAADPVGDFFKKVGRSISHLGKTKAPSRNARKTTTKDGDNKGETSAATDDQRRGRPQCHQTTGPRRRRWTYGALRAPLPTVRDGAMFLMGWPCRTGPAL